MLGGPHHCRYTRWEKMFGDCILQLPLLFNLVMASCRQSSASRALARQQPLWEAPRGERQCSIHCAQ